MPYINSNEMLVAIHSGSTGVDDNGFGRGATGSRITHSKDFILNTVDAWHYPTLATTVSGTTTIKVQSLHKNAVADAAYTDGDATITGGTCMGASTIQPFATCTYQVASNGGEGKLYLSGSEAVTINKRVAPTPTPGGNGNSGSGSGSNNGGGSGGSLGFLSLLGLFGALRLRQSTK